MRARGIKKRAQRVEREVWVSYRLQSLPTTRLINVVNRILRGDAILLGVSDRAKLLELPPVSDRMGM